MCSAIQARSSRTCFGTGGRVRIAHAVVLGAQEAGHHAHQPVVGGVDVSLFSERREPRADEPVEVVVDRPRAIVVGARAQLVEPQGEPGIHIDQRRVAAGRAVRGIGDQAGLADEHAHQGAQIPHLARPVAHRGVDLDADDRRALGDAAAEVAVEAPPRAVGAVVDHDRQVRAGVGQGAEIADHLVVGKGEPEGQGHLDRVGPQPLREARPAHGAARVGGGAADLHRGSRFPAHLDRGGGDRLELVEIHGVELAGRAARIDAWERRRRSTWPRRAGRRPPRSGRRRSTAPVDRPTCPGGALGSTRVPS